MKKQSANEHTIGYAYPTSALAIELKKGKSGTFYLKVGGQIYPHETAQAAKAATEGLGTTPSWDSIDHPAHADLPCARHFKP